ncbi:hypothetical protein [Roseovarius sp. MMSF_3281]|uniref:hypothetical protein n=1 Tax=Roseovarius sp. MMSF_3281 TaxID=3046694 RepID=UPI0027400E62|nr:hypothetical protein [Roseovarius sp. MMSF_3281]
MKTLTPALAIMIATAPASAQNTNGIQNHPVQEQFMTEPCAAVISTIDNVTATPEGIGNMALAFGFLMGFEAANPGIRGDHETVLIRLRADCAETPNSTAMSLLRAYTAQ